MRCVCDDDELTCWGDCDRLILPPPGPSSQLPGSPVPMAPLAIMLVFAVILLAYLASRGWL